MRDFVLMYLNGKRLEVRGEAVFQPLSTFLRNDKSLVGTKIVCSEGDCGACTVLVGRNGKYESIDSCILFVYQLDGASVLTIEALKHDGQLHPAQQAMIDCHGSQCGFCTPGFVMSLAGMCENGDSDSREAVVGNLCRCTGYLPIINAGERATKAHGARSVDGTPSPGTPGEGQGEGRISEPLISRYPVLEELNRVTADSFQVSYHDKLVFKPATLAEALAFRAEHRSCTIIAGNTDIGVRYNKGLIDPKIILSISGLDELRQIELIQEKLMIGSAARWCEVEKLVEDSVAEFAAILELFGSPQIRNAGTIGGNIVNASPIADSLPMLFVMEAELEIASTRGTRRVRIDKFYKGYKILDLAPDELLVRVHLPVPQTRAAVSHGLSSSNEILKLYKVSKRRHLDISTFTAAVWMKRNGEAIESARIVYGGVGPVVLRLPKTEAFLAGKEFREETFAQAGEMAVNEITPISDVRGSREYRNLLAENIMMKFYFDVSDANAVTV